LGASPQKLFGRGGDRPHGVGAYGGNVAGENDTAANCCREHSAGPDMRYTRTESSAVSDEE